MNFENSQVIIALRHQKVALPTNSKRSKACSSSSRWFEESDEEDMDPAYQQQICHTAILYKESPYFAALFGQDFCESKSSIVYLPTSIINIKSLNHIIHYMHMHEIEDTQSIMELCDLYRAADYLGMNTLCLFIIDTYHTVVHGYMCYCDTCVVEVPQLFAFCRDRLTQFEDDRITDTTQKIIQLLANDPEKSLSTYWTSRHMAQLLTQLPPETSLALSQKVLFRVNKSNAIESLYACFTASHALSTNDPLLSWSKPLHSTLTSVQSKATRIIATHFDFFCCQYPALLSCIDGITYSFDFLEYLLLHILEDQMECYNVGILYRGVVCDLMSRHAVQYNDHVRHILNVARVMILCYITRRITDIRKQGGLDKLEINILKLLADDLDLKPKALISTRHPLSNKGLFSFFLPSVPDLHISSASTHTNGLSRHSSRSTTTSRRINVPSQQQNACTRFAKRVARTLEKIGCYQHHHYYARPPPKRNASATTVHTNTTTYSSSWLQIQLSTNKERKKLASSYSKKFQKKRFNARQHIGLNKRVQLIRRPSLTVGTVLFIGHVNFAEGIWIGVELDRRAGKNDGSVDGYRYFSTSPNRGVFVRPEDVALVL